MAHDHRHETALDTGNHARPIAITLALVVLYMGLEVVGGVVSGSLALLADRSRIATLVRGRDAPGWGIRAFSGGSSVPLTAQQEAWRSEAVPVALALIGAGRFDVEIGARYALADAAKAQSDSQAGAQGKLILVP